MGNIAGLHLAPTPTSDGSGGAAAAGEAKSGAVEASGADAAPVVPPATPPPRGDKLGGHVPRCGVLDEVEGWGKGGAGASYELAARVAAAAAVVRVLHTIVEGGTEGGNGWGGPGCLTACPGRATWEGLTRGMKSALGVRLREAVGKVEDDAVAIEVVYSGGKLAVARLMWQHVLCSWLSADALQGVRREVRRLLVAVCGSHQAYRTCRYF